MEEKVDEMKEIIIDRVIVYMSCKNVAPNIAMSQYLMWNVFFYKFFFHFHERLVASVFCMWTFIPDYRVNSVVHWRDGIVNEILIEVFECCHNTFWEFLIGFEGDVLFYSFLL